MWKTEPKLFQNYTNWNTRQEAVFKRTYLRRIVSLCKNCMKSFSKAKQSQRDASIVKKFEKTVPERQLASIQEVFLQFWHKETIL